MSMSKEQSQVKGGESHDHKWNDWKDHVIMDRVKGNSTYATMGGVKGGELCNSGKVHGNRRSRDKGTYRLFLSCW